MTAAIVTALVVYAFFCAVVVVCGWLERSLSEGKL